MIPQLGWPLGTRAQMFWLEEGLPSSLRPGARPGRRSVPGSLSATASPTWPGERREVTSRSSGRSTSSSDTSTVGPNLQEAIDAPDFHTDHLISSFYPRGFAAPVGLTVEERFGDEVVDDLRRRGHDVQVAGPWSLGRVTAVAREQDGLLKAGANPRGMQGYAVGR